jgi:type IV secretory pathway VirB6-like protein
MKSKVLNFLLIITSLFGYLEWGGNNHTFLFAAEAEIISKLFTEPGSILHPFTILPLVGQILLLVTLFQKKPSKLLTLLSIGGLGILMGLMFVIGLMSLNYKIIFSTVPFLIVAVITILHNRKLKNSSK